KVCQGAIAPSELPRLGLEVAATLETLAERDAESEVPEVPSFDDWVPTVDPMEEEPEPEDWDAVKNMASLLT
ncbi:MAG TPA: hypothetical protein VFU47_12240, partial [Armatimonadota bacterium]|nr:hypothetical protein [Armatimonadota bacterium]